MHLPEARSRLCLAQAGDGFKFVEVPYPPALEAEFLPSKLTGEDYPNLVQKTRESRPLE